MSTKEDKINDQKYLLIWVIYDKVKEKILVRKYTIKFTIIL